MANKYVAIELRTDFDGKFTVSKYEKPTRDEAERAYHSILTSAATSQTLIHAATILNPEGKLIKNECYKHEPPQPEPEPEPQPEPEPTEEPEEEGEE